MEIIACIWQTDNKIFNYSESLSTRAEYNWSADLNWAFMFCESIFIRCFLLSSDKQTFMDYVMRRRSTVGGALEMFSLPLPLPLH